MRVKLGRRVGRFLIVVAFGVGVLGASSLAAADETPVEPPGGAGWEDVTPDGAGWEEKKPDGAGWEGPQPDSASWE